MGYSHRFQLLKAPTQKEWAKICTRVNRILSAAKDQGIELAYETDLPDHPPLVTRGAIRFNGVGAQGYETFLIQRMDQRPQWIKTGPDVHKGRAYDPVVVSVLHAIKEVLGDKIQINAAGLLIQSFEIERVKCSLCGKPGPKVKAHRHGGKWIGEECWDERLRTTE